MAGKRGGDGELERTGPDSTARTARNNRGRRDQPVPDDPERLTREVCLRLLTAAPRTRAQLAAALTRRGIPEDAFAPVLDRFTDVGLIDDRAFARAWVTSRHHGRGLARRALAAELRGRGVDGELIDDAVAELDPAAEEETARALVRRRLPATANVDPVTRTRRLLGMLARKGYPPGLAYRVVREVLEERGDGPDGAWPDEPVEEGP